MNSIEIEICKYVYMLSDFYIHKNNTSRKCVLGVMQWQPKKVSEKKAAKLTLFEPQQVRCVKEACSGSLES